MGRIVITGSTRGIGRALTERFMEAGWSVVINGRSSRTVSEALVELNTGHSGNLCSGLAGSVDSITDMQKLWSFAAKAGPVDVWINNAGIDQSRSRVWELEAEELDAVIRTNVIGSFTGSRAAAEGMMMQRYGIIYQMEGFGSDGMVQPGLAAYGASKSAVRYLARALAIELKKAGSAVRSGAISPGMVMTDLLKAGLPDNREEKAQLLRIYDILADRPETVSAYISGKIISGPPAKIRWLTNGKAGWRFATAFLRKGRFSKGM